MGYVRTTWTSSRAWSVSGWLNGCTGTYGAHGPVSRRSGSILGVHVARDVPKPEDERADHGHHHHRERNPDEHLAVPWPVDPAGGDYSAEAMQCESSIAHEGGVVPESN